MLAQVNWGPIADWVSGIGSLSACITALYLAKKQNKIQITASCGPRLVIQNGFPNTEVISFIAINVGNRSTIINGIGFSVGYIKKRHCIVTIMKSRTSQAVPLALSDGQEGHWTIEKNLPTPWYPEFCNGFINTIRDVDSLKVLFYTTNGGMFSFKPDNTFKQELKDFLRLKTS